MTEPPETPIPTPTSSEAEPGSSSRPRTERRKTARVEPAAGPAPVSRRKKNPRSPAKSRDEPHIVARTLPLESRRVRFGPRERIDLDDPALYLNRELTYLAFNRRVLQMAQDPRTPLLERVKFLSIVSSNLDEFFMKRMGGLKQQIGAGIHKLTVDGRSPEEQIAECHQEIRLIEKDKNALFLSLVGELEQNGIRITGYNGLTTRQKGWLRTHFQENIFPLLTPLGIDPAHPFPFISNLSLNLIACLRMSEESDEVLARIKVPVGEDVPRLVPVEEAGIFVPLEDVIAQNLDLLFPDMTVVSCKAFRVVRNSNTEKDEENADDLVALIESELRERKFAPIVRLEVEAGMNPHNRGMIAAELGLDDEDVFEAEGLMGKRDLMEIANLPLMRLKHPPHTPVDHPVFNEERNFFHIVRDAGAILLHHPYQSFSSSVNRFLREASIDPKVRAIKMTVYRTSSDSAIIQYLIDAARNGKHVSVVMELKARFDEAANLEWGSRLEEVGIHVNYGVVGFKTHCKLILVVRRDYDGLRRYVHAGTGNYHAGNARAYSDLGILTIDTAIGHDVTQLFNYLTTGFSPKRRYEKLLVAPVHMKNELLMRIDREIRLHTKNAPGLIQIKTNALEGSDTTRALYRAAQAGVKVDLIVRDTCRFRPGIPGLSETARVVSVVGQFLEHARIYYFRNGGDEEYFIGSADCMKRNLESRVEVLVPVELPRLRTEIRHMLDCQLADVRSGWQMSADGSYTLYRPTSKRDQKSCQELFIERAQQSVRRISRPKRRFLKAKAKANSKAKAKAKSSRKKR